MQSTPYTHIEFRHFVLGRRRLRLTVEESVKLRFIAWRSDMTLTEFLGAVLCDHDVESRESKQDKEQTDAQLIDKIKKYITEDERLVCPINAEMLAGAGISADPIPIDLHIRINPRKKLVLIVPYSRWCRLQKAAGNHKKSISTYLKNKVKNTPESEAKNALISAINACD